VAGDVLEVVVGRQHRKIMTDAKLGQKGVDRTDLDSGAPTSIPQFGGPDVIVSVWNQ
jgi:hypothetical protein